MPAKNTCRVVEGRLLEIDVANGYQKVSDVDEMIAMIRAAVAMVPEPTRLVIAADWRKCRLFGEDVAARATQMLIGSAERIERSAILHGTDHATAVLQVFRLVKEASQTHRQLFTAVWGNSYGDMQQYLRVHVRAVRRKIERDPVRPRLIVKEPGVGYRFEMER